MPPSREPPAAQPNLSLEEMLRIMDVAGTLRREKTVVEQQFEIGTQKEFIRDKLLTAAKVAGEELTAEQADTAIAWYYERMHRYEDPPLSFSVALAHLYVLRNRIAATIGVTTTALLFGWCIFFSSLSPLSSASQEARQITAAQTSIRQLLAQIRARTSTPSVLAEAERLERQAGEYAARRSVPPLEEVKKSLEQLNLGLGEWDQLLSEISKLARELRGRESDPRVLADVTLLEQQAKAHEEARNLVGLRDVRGQLSKLSEQGISLETLRIAIRNLLTELKSVQDPAVQSSVAAFSLRAEEFTKSRNVAGLEDVRRGLADLKTQIAQLDQLQAEIKKLVVELGPLATTEALKADVKSSELQANQFVAARNVAGLQGVSRHLSDLVQQIMQLNQAQAEIKSLVVELTTLAKEPEVQAEIKQFEQQAAEFATARALTELQGIQRKLTELAAALRSEYVVEIVVGPKSAIDRYYTDRQGKRVSGFYVIVQMRDVQGNVLSRTVRNRETDTVETVQTWGEQVPKEVYDRLKADKQADGVLDERKFAVKERGFRHERITLPGANGQPVEQLGQITKW